MKNSAKTHVVQEEGKIVGRSYEKAKKEKRGGVAGGRPKNKEKQKTMPESQRHPVGRTESGGIRPKERPQMHEKGVGGEKKEHKT